jgi:hypothetical protein
MGKKREKIETIKSEIVAKHPGGRPLTYDEKLHPLLAKSLAAQGKTNMEIAEEMDIAEKTFYQWRSDHIEFSQAILDGKDELINQVEKSLYRKAIGYENKKAVKIFQFQGEEVVVPYTEIIHPDVTAQKFILSNRRPKEWSEKQALELAGKDGQLPVFQVVFVDPNKPEDKKDE